MLIHETGDVLLRMLAEEGITPGVSDVISIRTFVPVFRRFATMRVEDAAPPDDDGDGLLAQFGTYTFRGRPEFSTNFTRQFIGRGDDDAPMWQLHCTLRWQPTSQTDGLASGSVWSFGKPLDQFFDEALALPG